MQCSCEWAQTCHCSSTETRKTGQGNSQAIGTAKVSLSATYCSGIMSSKWVVWPSANKPTRKGGSTMTGRLCPSKSHSATNTHRLLVLTQTQIVLRLHLSLTAGNPLHQEHHSRQFALEALELALCRKKSARDQCMDANKHLVSKIDRNKSLIPFCSCQLAKPQHASGTSTISLAKAAFLGNFRWAHSQQLFQARKMQKMQKEIWW